MIDIVYWFLATFDLASNAACETFYCLYNVHSRFDTFVPHDDVVLTCYTFVRLMDIESLGKHETLRGKT